VEAEFQMLAEVQVAVAVGFPALSVKETAVPLFPAGLFHKFPVTGTAPVSFPDSLTALPAPKFTLID
jgi:hypothetical protein